MKFVNWNVFEGLYPGGFLDFFRWLSMREVWYNRKKKLNRLMETKAFIWWWITVFCQCHVTGIFDIMAQKWTMADLYFLSYANTRRNNVKRAQASVLSTQETSASLDSTQWSMTGNSGRKQMMSSRGHELVLNLWWQEHMVPTHPQPADPHRPMIYL